MKKKMVQWFGLARRSTIVMAIFVLLFSIAFAEVLTIGNGYMNVGGPKEIHSMPDPNSEIITTLAMGEPCNILTVGGDWIEIEYYKEIGGRGTGYVTKSGIVKASSNDPTIPSQGSQSNSSTQAQTSQQTSIPAAPQPTSSIVHGTAVVNNPNGQLLNLRKSASVDSKSLGLYYTGVEVICNSDPAKEWVNVTIGNYRGYMKSEFLYRDTAPDSIVPQMPSAVVTNPTLNGWLNLRNEPSLDAQVLGRFYNGDTVTILGVVDNWYHVKAGDIYGFMLSDYLSIIDITPSSMPIGSRHYSTTQYIMRGYTISASVIETSKNMFDVSVQTIVDPSIKLNSYPSSYNLYFNRSLVASIPTTQDVTQIPIPTQFAGQVLYSNEISIVQVIPVDSQGTEYNSEAVFLK